jgi:hypothetical protein
VLGILLPWPLVLEMLELLPVLAQEESRTGQNPATVKRNKDIDFISLTFIDTLSGRYDTKECLIVTRIRDVEVADESALKPVENKAPRKDKLDQVR